MQAVIGTLFLLGTPTDAYIVCYTEYDRTETQQEIILDCHVKGSHAIIECRFYCDQQYFSIECYEEEGFGGMCTDRFPTIINVNCTPGDANCDPDLVDCPDPNGVYQEKLCEEECDLCPGYQ